METAKDFLKHFKSAQKISLLAIVGAVVAGLFTGHIDSDKFLTIATPVIMFYFHEKKDIRIAELTEAIKTI